MKSARKRSWKAALQGSIRLLRCQVDRSTRVSLRLRIYTHVFSPEIDLHTSPPGDEISSALDPSEATQAGTQVSQPPSQTVGAGKSPDSTTQTEVGADRRRLLRSAEPVHNTQSSSGALSDQDEGQAGEEPMVRLIQQIMGMPPSGANPASEPDTLPPNLATLLGGGAAGGTQAGRPTSTNAYVWKILHAIFALALGAYILVSYSFTGSLASRLRVTSIYPTLDGSVFWAFVTAELGLQAARYLLGGVQEYGGTIGTLAGFLPPPWKERLLLAGRYSGIWTTVVEDAMVVVWLLGAAAWYNGDFL